MAKSDDLNISLHTQQALGFALPPLVPFQTHPSASYTKDYTYKESEFSRKSLFQCPLTFKIPSTGYEFKLPSDPQISVSGRNTVVRRYVSRQGRQRGSIKERWSQDDYDVNISGVLMADADGTIEEYTENLLKIANARESIVLTGEALNEKYNIKRIAIESVDLPFTKGMDYQTFTIKAYSDEESELFIKI